MEPRHLCSGNWFRKNKDWFKWTFGRLPKGFRTNALFQKSLIFHMMNESFVQINYLFAELEKPFELACSTDLLEFDLRTELLARSCEALKKGLTPRLYT